MAFVTEKEELKPGLIIFRRGDVEHRMWYCRMKMPKADRYKTVSLKTSDKEAARETAAHLAGRYLPCLHRSGR
jgi:integrase